MSYIFCSYFLWSISHPEKTGTPQHDLSNDNEASVSCGKLTATQLAIDNNVTHPTGLVEIKNPYSTRQLTLTEACNSSTFCLEQKQRDGQVAYRLKRKHDYYYQVQCQLYCADKAWCDFVLRTEMELHVERVYRDHSWWSEQIPKLKTFYFNALLPELACPRHGKGGIREPITHS